MLALILYSIIIYWIMMVHMVVCGSYIWGRCKNYAYAKSYNSYVYTVSRIGFILFLLYALVLLPALLLISPEEISYVMYLKIGSIAYISSYLICLFCFSFVFVLYRYTRSISAYIFISAFIMYLFYGFSEDLFLHIIPVLWGLVFPG